MTVFSVLKRLVELVVLAAITYYLVGAVQVVLASRAPGAAGAAPVRPVAIVVGTGSAKPPLALDEDFKVRLDHGAALERAHRATRVVVLCSAPTQAAKARAFLVHLGVPASRISTYSAKEIPGAFHLYATKGQPHEALLVADSWQIFWLGHVATAEGIDVAASPVAPVHGGIGNEAATVAVQGAAIAWGRIAGFAQTGFIAG